jgi:hypothetical protein
MTTEDTQGSDNFDAGTFYDEGVEAAGGDEAVSEALDLDPETQDDQTAPQETPGAMSQVTKDSEEETQQTEQTGDETAEAAKAALESTEQQEEEESAEQAESVIAQILPGAEEKPAQRVPLSEHIKERQRRQAAEKALAERDAQQQAEEPAADQKSPLKKFVEENPDDDYVPAAVQLEQREWDEARARRAAEAHQKAQDEARQAAEAEAKRIADQQTFATKAETSEKVFRKEHPDYEAVTRPFVAGRKLTTEQLQDIAKADNPAQRLYEVCQAERSLLRDALGIETAEPTRQAPNAREKPSDEEAGGDMTDEEVFDEVYG